MSQVYTLEPPTKGKVVLRTTMGDLDIELWAKEVPRAVRNFVQLCLEGYYDGTPVHRVVKDFMIQGGDPTGTGKGGDSVYGRPFGDEFHSRLKFNHRGLVACANQNAPDTNGSQFFVTMDRADHLDRKATIFGKVTGDTIYNLMRFNELEVGDNDRPVHPPLVTRADVLWNPFDDIKPRVDRDAKQASVGEATAAKEAEAKRARKGAKNFALISFGEEAEEEEAAEEDAAAELKIKSAHDALEDDKLSKEAAVEVDLEKVRAAMQAAKSGQRQGGGRQGEGEQDFAERMTERVQGKRKAAEPAAGRPSSAAAAAEGAAASQSEPESSEGEGEEDRQRHTGSKQSRLVDQGRGAKSSSAVVAPSRQLQVADGELLSAWERKRQEYKERKRLGGHREKDTMSKLASFMGKLKSKAPEPAGAAIAGESGAAEAAAREAAAGAAQAAGYDGKVDDAADHRAFLPAAWRVDSYLTDEAADADGDSLESLRAHKLVFQSGQGGKDSMQRTEQVDDYIVHDPLLEKGKDKFNKKQQQMKKRGTEWARR